MAAMTTASPGPRYAPEDPSLPKPWKGLVDGRTGYLYFWNPETNVTQYERPVSRPLSGYISSLAEVQQSSKRKDAYNADDDKYVKVANGEKSQQVYLFLVRFVVILFSNNWQIMLTLRVQLETQAI